MSGTEGRIYWTLHQRGKTWAEIAKEFGVTRKRAQRKGIAYQRRMDGTRKKEPMPFSGDCGKHGPWWFYRDHCPKCWWHFKERSK